MLCMMAIAIMPSLMSSCKNDEPEPGPEPTPTADRTVLAYMIATNNLSAFAIDDLAEMKQAAKEGQLGNGKFLVYYVNRKGAPVLLDIHKNGVDTLKQYDASVVSLSVNQMRTVVEDAKRLAPSKGMGIVFWGHASAWWQNGIVEQSRSYGSDNGAWMNISSMGEALRGQDLEFIYFDCCFMGAVEVLYELRDVAPIIGASPTEIKVEGLPYDKVMRHFFATPQADIKAVAKAYFDYFDYYFKNPDMDYDAEHDCPYAIAAYDMTMLDNLAAVTAKVYKQATVLWPDTYKPLCLGLLSYRFYDMQDYVRVLCGDDTALYEQWKNALSKLVIYTDKCPYIWEPTSPIISWGGLSTYMYYDESTAAYKGYDTTSWYRDLCTLLPAK